MKPFTLLPILIFLVLITSTAWGQQNFVPLKDGEYTTQKEPAPAISDAVISGSYKTTYEGKRIGTIGGRTGASQMVYEIEIGFRSQVHDTVSVNAIFANFSDQSVRQTDHYWGGYFMEEWDASTDQGSGLIFKESFLEYDHNPSAILRLGRQKFSTGDRMGLVYKGIATGISQTCRVGTWCTYAGSARLGKGSGNTLDFAQLTYPVYETGLEIKDKFTGKVRQEEGLYLELFRNFYHANKQPLALYGGRATKNAAAQATTSTGKRVAFDNRKTEYFGLNGSWYMPNYQFFFNYIANAGDRNYFAGDNYEEYLGQRRVTGNLWYLRGSYDQSEKVRFGLDYFSSTGDKADPSTPVWERDLTGYREVQKGYFGDALIFFQGQQQTGEGHSVYNLNFKAAHFKYKDPGLPWKVDTSVYQFAKTNAQLDENGTPVRAIGRELDILYTNQLETNFNFAFGYAVFSPDSAYGADDNFAPTGGKTFSSVSGQLNYQF